VKSRFGSNPESIVDARSYRRAVATNYESLVMMNILKKKFVIVCSGFPYVEPETLISPMIFVTIMMSSLWAILILPKFHNIFNMVLLYSHKEFRNMQWRRKCNESK
jgi:hypothetical protein